MMAVLILTPFTSYGAGNVNVPSAIRDQYRNLIIQNDPTSPNQLIDITADEVMLQDPHGSPARVSNVSLVANIVSSGANGLDTGSATANTWYHIWLISDGTTVASLLSTSATSPVMPAGYVYMAYIGADYLNGSENFISITQRNNKVDVPVSFVLNGGTQPCPTLSYVDASSQIPVTATRIAGYLNYNTGPSVGMGFGALASTGSQYWVGVRVPVQAYSPGATTLSGAYVIDVMIPQTFYYCTGGPGTVSVAITTWEY